jgi:hypothetical protein
MPPNTTGGVKRRQNTAPPVSDFKRIKAKVGKKAPKPASYTDTTFRKASLHVANSNNTPAAAVDDGDVRSSRGRSLTIIAQQLSHTTISIRQAAAKGLLDIVSSSSSSSSSSTSREDLRLPKKEHNSTTIASWQTHLSTVLPALGQCLVDEDTTVRSTGVSAWQHIVQQSSESLLRPFWEVFMAFVISGMNSLDHRVRRDSRIIVADAGRRVPTLVTPFANRLLPALMRLLEDKTFQYHSQVSSSEGGDMGTAVTTKRNRNGRQVWLETLVIILHTVQRHGVGNEYKLSTAGQLRNTTEWTFTPGSTSKNAVFVASKGKSTTELLSMQQWWLTQVGSGEADWGAAYHKKDECLTTNVVTEVWTKLRDLLLELLESNNNTETLLVWSQAVLALLSTKGGSHMSNETDRLIPQIQGLVLKYEPSDSMVNLWMLTLTQLSHSLPASTDTKRKSSWIPKVVAYLLEENDGTSLDEVRLQVFQRILENPSVVNSSAGRKIVHSLIHNWEESTNILAPRLYEAASVEDRHLLLQQMMNFCVLAGNEKDESSIAAIFEFILDKTRNPQDTPDDLLNRFMPIWENDVVLKYIQGSTQYLAISLLLNLITIQGMNTTVLDALCRLCKGLSNTTAPASDKSSLISLVQDAVFDLRKELPLARFFGFLMDVTGVANLGDDSLKRDKHIQSAASYLLGSGVSNVKILTMLWPLWQTWLSAESCGVKRAALCFLAVLAVDEGSQTFLTQKQLGDDASLVILKAIMSVIQQKERSPASFPWFQPIATLLRIESWMWQPLLCEISKDLSKIEPVLLYNCRHLICETILPIRENAALIDGLGEIARELEETAQESPLHVAARDLTDGIKALATRIPVETQQNVDSKSIE